MMSSVYAAQLETTIDIRPSVTEVSAGDNVVFTFVIKNVVNAQDNSIGAIAGKVTYDTNFFELVKGVQNTTFTEGGESGAAFNVLATAKEGETIAILTLKVKDNPTGSGVVNFTELEASDGDMNKTGNEGIAKTPDKQIEIKLKSSTNPKDDNIAVTGVTVTSASEKIKEEVISNTEDPSDPEISDDVDQDQPTTDGMTVTVGKNNDSTIADKDYDKAGVNAIIITALLVASVITIVIYKKNQKYRDIK